MNKDLFNSFIINFFEAIEAEFENIMKKEKSKKLSVGEFEVDAIDYLDNSKTPIIETIKETPEGILLYLKNKEEVPSGYTVEEIFHPFSLAILADKLIGKEKYTKILENFYMDSEDIVREFLKEKNVETLSIEELGFEVLAISKASGVYKLAEGIVSEILLINSRVFFNIKNDEDQETVMVHIVECNAADLAMLLNNMFFPVE
ncbi:hypothetical protein [Cetobacterium sp.]|uniref:hypothetical protein n=1 Tax=Cetobacterium sp. TaxID=2071632 RepID=UPI002FC65712